MPLCTELCIYLKSHQKKFRSFRSIFQAGPSIFVNTKEFQKNTKENIPVTAFCSHSSQEGPINSISSPDCCICNTLSRDTHIACHKSHIAIWPYGHMAKIWPYGLMAIFKYGHHGSLYGCLWRKQYKCSNLVKKLN